MHSIVLLCRLDGAAAWQGTMLDAVMLPNTLEVLLKTVEALLFELFTPQQQAALCCMHTVSTRLFLLVSQEHPLALPKIMLVGNAMLGSYTLLLASSESQLAKERNGLPVPVQHKDVILVHHRIIATPNCLQTEPVGEAH